MILTGYNEGHGAGRAVELLADLLARDAAARADSRGGRPSRLTLVGAVLAADADPRAGRYAFPGREQTAELVGGTPRSVTNLWARCQALKWAERTREGRKLSLVERIELQRFNDRAEFDLVPLHRGSTAARARYIPRAVQVYRELLERVYGLLRAAEGDLDALRAQIPAGPPVEAERRARWQLRVAVREARESVLWITELSGEQVLSGLFSPRAASDGECVSSCSFRGLRFSPPIKIHSSSDRVHRPLRGRMEVRASRSSTRAGRFGHGDLGGVGWSRGPRPAPQHTKRPRKPGAGRSASRVAPGWVAWAPALAQDLAQLLPWLRNARRARVVATLGGNLASRPYGNPWTAPELVAQIMAARSGRPLLDEPDHAVSYLKTLLRQLPPGLRRDDLVADERRALHRAQSAALRARREQRDREHAAHAAAAAAPNAAYRAARRALNQRLSAKRTTTPPARRSTVADSKFWEAHHDQP